MNAATPDEPRSPGAKMTLRVYTVDRYGAVAEDRGTVSVPYSQEPPPMMTLTPPCACKRCVVGQGVSR